ncbi:conserved hypothetical protein [Xenorhabdus nematophila F1]|uniref:Uncharacterized protein n=1 Tax=Xenorhabdus nematophila (strain ATCC 19061 / DSM 3370 / CCUG 14189 / LMG 1036 / NCIMB 9965 / AN6) TaxID=406817 RepID=D3VL02_XENNA|nr:hypothetical protein XNC1_0890 [Xenorhabdus nematophila ATCC 19061]CCW32690.1 conserved hypothetical protein [Xenorhabdus nematophila F1]
MAKLERMSQVLDNRRQLIRKRKMNFREFLPENRTGAKI